MTYPRLFIVLFSFALFPFAATVSSLHFRFIDPNDPSVTFSHGWSIPPSWVPFNASFAQTTQHGASFNVVLPLGATQVLLLGSSSFQNNKLAVCLDCRHPWDVTRSEIVSASAESTSRNVDHVSTVLLDLKVDPRASHVLTIVNMLDPWSDFAGKLSLDALVVAMQQATLFARSDDSNDSEDFDYLPRRPSSLPDKYRQSLIDPLVRITGMFQDWLDRHSKPSSALNPTSTPVTSPLPTTPPSTPSTPSPTPTTLSPSAPLSSSQVPSTPSDTPTGTPTPTTSSPVPTSSGGNPSGSETSPNVTASVSSSSGPSYPSTTSTPSSPVKQSSDSESNAVLESSPSNSLSSTHHGISKSILAVIVVFTLFIFFALVLAAIAFCVHRARRSASPSLKSDDEQMNYDRRDPNPPVVTVIPEMQTSRPLSDISVYSEPHSFAPRNADTHHVDRPVITPLRLDSSLPTPELGGGGMAAQSFSAELQPPSSQWAYEYEASSDDGSPRTTNRPLPATPPTAPLSFRRRD